MLAAPTGFAGITSVLLAYPTGTSFRSRKAPSVLPLRDPACQSPPVAVARSQADVKGNVGFSRSP